MILMSPQGVCLVLSSFQAAKFLPSQQTLDCSADILYRGLPLFKPSEIATCLEAFSFFSYQPPDKLVEASLRSHDCMASAGRCLKFSTSSGILTLLTLLSKGYALASLSSVSGSHKLFLAFSTQSAKKLLTLEVAS